MCSWERERARVQRQMIKASDPLRAPIGGATLDGPLVVLPISLACERARGEKTTHVYLSVRQQSVAVAGTAAHCGCMQAAGPRISPNRFARQLLHRACKILSFSRSVLQTKSTKKEAVIFCATADFPQCGGASVESGCRLPPRRNPKGWSADFSHYIGNLKIRGFVSYLNFLEQIYCSKPTQSK